MPISSYFKFAILLCMTGLPVACCRVSHQHTEHASDNPTFTWNSNYISKPEALPKGDDIPLARLDYSDTITMAIVRELLDQNEIEYHLFPHHGCNILVRKVHFKRAKALLQGETRLRGRRISIATSDPV